MDENKRNNEAVELDESELAEVSGGAVDVWKMNDAQLAAYYQKLLGSKLCPSCGKRKLVFEKLIPSNRTAQGVCPGCGKHVVVNSSGSIKRIW